jgi:PPOX class probable FMN-dependent enzyme
MIGTSADLRECYAPAIERARLKVQHRLDEHCKNFIALSPFLCLGTSSSTGADVTPRGDAPGFVKVLDDTRVAMPDWPGNNRLDSLENILENPAVGLLFFVPGVDETLRLNGTAQISTDPELLALWNVGGKQPKSALIVTLGEAFLHCAKALIRSHLWDGTYQVDRSVLPSYGRMLKDQIEISDSAEQIEKLVAEGYRDRLY